MFSFFKSSSFISPLLTSTTPLVFAHNVEYLNKKYFTQKDLILSSLDPKSSSELIYVWYKDCRFKGDSLLFDSLGITFDLFVIGTKKIGREYPKTHVYQMMSRGEIMIEVLAGVGYVILEHSKTQEVKIISCKAKSIIHIPQDFSFICYNVQAKENLVFLCARKKDILYTSQELMPTLFYTQSGFVRNQNAKSNYVVEEVENNYFIQNKELYKPQLYEQIRKGDFTLLN